MAYDTYVYVGEAMKRMILVAMIVGGSGFAYAGEACIDPFEKVQLEILTGIIPAATAMRSVVASTQVTSDVACWERFPNGSRMRIPCGGGLTWQLRHCDASGCDSQTPRIYSDTERSIFPAGASGVYVLTVRHPSGAACSTTYRRGDIRGLNW